MTLTVEPHSSSLGMEANIAVLIAYLGGIVIGWIPWFSYIAFLIPLIIFILEKNSKFVRFHAVQSFILSIIGLVMGFLLSLISRLIAPLFFSSSPDAALSIMSAVSFTGVLISLVILLIAIIAVINAFQYKKCRLPLLGDLADKMLAKGDDIFKKTAEKAR